MKRALPVVVAVAAFEECLKGSRKCFYLRVQGCIVALLLRIFSGHPPAAIIAAEPHFVQDIGLSDHLSPNRSNGLHAMIGTMKAIAAQKLAEGVG